MNCTNCGRELDDGAAFCANCGTAVEASPASADGATQDEPTGRSRIWLIAAALLGALSAILLLITLVLGGLLLFREPETIRVRVTREVEVDREITRIVEVTREIFVEALVEVTRVVVEQVVVQPPPIEVTRIVTETVIETVIVEVTPEPDDGDAILAAARDGAYDGSVVTIMGAFGDPDIGRFEASVAAFEAETGIDIQIEGFGGDFSNVLEVRVAAGEPPDIAGHPQPGLVQAHVEQNVVIDPSTFLGLDFLERQYAQGWLDDATIGGQIAGVWYRGNVKSLVWYPLDDFAAANYDVPETWDEMLALSDQIVDDGGVPWCIGIESASATGWVATDWIEEIMLRTQPPEVFDAWTSGELLFNSPEVRNAFNVLGEIWFNPDYVLGGQDGIVETSFADAADGLFGDPPACWLHRQASFLPAFFPSDAEYGEDYDFFLLPPIDPEFGAPILTAGDIAVMYNDRPEVRAVMAYLATGESMRGWIEAGSFVAPHNDQDLEWYRTDEYRRYADLLLNATTTRFDGSDRMPAEVAVDAFWEEVTAWVSGADLDDVLTAIDAAWPR